MEKITSIILHYRRKENVKRWIEGIKKQTIQSKIIVWDNSGDYPKGSGEDILISSTENFLCQPRFLIAGFAQTDYIYNQDDDLAIKDNTLFEKFIEVSEKYPKSIIGWNGRVLSKDINWSHAYSFPGHGFVDVMKIEDNYEVDIINVGVSFFRTELINQIPINPFKNNIVSISKEEYKYADDIWVSYWTRNKRVMPINLRMYYEFLNEYEERQAALSKQTPHMNVRDSVCNKLFKELFFNKD